MIIPAIETLYKIFDSLNNKYFQSKLKQPIITIQTQGRYNGKSQILGWCSSEPIWTHKDSKQKDVKHYEINICAETLQRDMIEIAATLQHEIVHYANSSYGIDDCKKGRHNEYFKELAERCDLKVTKQRGRGWGNTEANEAFVNFIVSLKLDQKVFDCYRELKLTKKTKREKKMFKYICPSCKTEAKAKVDANIICGECNQEFVMVEEKEKEE